MAATLLAFLATAGLFYVNIMAALVAGLVDGLGLSNREAGLVASANVYGAAVGALVAVLLVKRVQWRPLAIGALLALMSIDAISMLIETARPLIAIRFMHGCVGGLLVGTAFAIIARTRSPDRTFGMLLVVQFGLGGLGVMLLPRLVPLYGPPVLFLALMVFSFVTLLMVPFLDDYPPGRVARPAAATGPVQWRLLSLTLLAVFLFQAANMGLAAYLIGLARHYGLETGFASTAIGIATWVGVAGPALVVVFGTRFGRTGPLAAGMVMTLVGTAAFHLSAQPWVYVLANCLTSITWAFVISYLLGMCAEFDQTGRTAALGGFISKLGLASGPMAGAMLMDSQAYPLLINAAVIALAAAAPAMLIPGRRLDRQQAASGQAA
jgi:predicted MFS family arabinose efflux permease